MNDLSFVVYDNWRENLSGVSTFIGNISALESSERVSFEVVEIKDKSAKSNSRIRTATKSADAAVVHPKAPPRPAPAWRLALGYLRLIIDDVLLLRRERKRLTGRLLVTNQFGCETLPIAMRIVFPFRRIIAIAHTHPGIDARGMHPVRCRIEKLCYASVSSLIYNSHAVRDEWRKKLGLNRIKGDVIWYGLAAAVEDAPACCVERSEDTIDFACVCRFVGWKGHRELLNAWKLACERVSAKIRLILVGDGPTQAEMKELAGSLGMGAENVVFVGSQPDGPLYYNLADVGIQLSTEPEAFGQVFLEAMSRKKAVIASRIGGIPEVVADGESGILVDPVDSDGCAEAITRLVESRELREKMGLAGYQRWQEKFTVERMLKSYEDSFVTMLSGGVAE